MIGVYNIAIMKAWMWAGTAAVVAKSFGPPAANKTLTAVPGIKVGHYTLAERPTGCTVVLVESGATAGVDVRGAAPATPTGANPPRSSLR